MAARRRPCDVCGHQRRSWQRLCDVCWPKLPGDIRQEIVDAWKQKRAADWRAAKRRAIAHLGRAVQRHMDTYRAQTARMLGERD